MRTKKKNPTEISEENRSKSWSSNPQNTKETDSPDKMGGKSRTEPIVNYEEGEDITVKDHKINNVTPQTDNIIMIYNETIKEVYSRNYEES